MENYNQKVKELIFEVETICCQEQLELQSEIFNDKSNEQSSISQLPNQYILKDNSLSNENQTSKCISNFVSVDKDQNVNTVDSDHSKENIYLSNETTFDQNINASLIQNEEADSDVSKSDCILNYSEETLDYSEEIQRKLVTNEFVEQSEDLKRASRRSTKRKKEFDECCPICGVTVRLPDLESHYNQEKEKLSKLNKNPKRSLPFEAAANETFEEIKRKREMRLTAQVARFTARAQNEVKCPVCSLRMSGTSEEINKHVALCIQEEDSTEEIDVDNTEEDESETFEEYEFGDQTRIRPISLIPGGFRALHGRTSTVQVSEDDDLNIDVDSTFTFGEPQYSELDVIPDIKSEKDKIDIDQLRKAVLKNSSVQPNILESRKWVKTETSVETPVSSSCRNSAELDPIVCSLKEKIKDLEDQSQNIKCLICLESYTKPVVSTTCWHVHCEECWLMTMGVKKLCPQCNMIVFPSDLRKIYL